MRHADHVVFTQMVSTHDAMVKGTLDIPNMIKFSDISQTFRLEIEVYGMVSSSLMTSYYITSLLCNT